MVGRETGVSNMKHRFKVKVRARGQLETKYVVAEDVLDAFHMVMDQYPVEWVDAEEVSIISYVREAP